MKYISKINKLFSIKVGKETEGVEVWILTWTSCTNQYMYTPVRAKAFLNKNDAEEYADSLKKANELLENETSLHINIEKQK